MDLLDHGARKFPAAPLLASSASLGWRGVAAELRKHPAGDLPPFQGAQLEITMTIDGVRDAIVSRKGGGVRQDTRVEPGALWISPVGVCEDDIRITRPLPRVLHVYLPAERFEQLADAGGRACAQSVRYMAGLRDDLVKQIGLSLWSEMCAPTAAGALLADSLALALAARLTQSYATGPSRRLEQARHAIDDQRIRRVVDYMVAHLGEPIGIDGLARVACVSPFHFARMFRAKTGLPPHRFLAELRMDAAKTMLRRGALPLSEVALACGFSDQSNFSRAFRKAVGASPAQYRASAE